MFFLTNRSMKLYCVLGFFFALAVQSALGFRPLSSRMISRNKNKQVFDLSKLSKTSLHDNDAGSAGSAGDKNDEMLVWDAKAGRFYERNLEEICEDEFCLIDDVCEYGLCLGDIYICW